LDAGEVVLAEGLTFLGRDFDFADGRILAGGEMGLVWGAFLEGGGTAFLGREDLGCGETTLSDLVWTFLVCTLAAVSADPGTFGPSLAGEVFGLAEVEGVLVWDRTAVEGDTAGFFWAFLEAAAFLAELADFRLDAAGALAFLATDGTGSGADSTGFAAGETDGFSFLCWLLLRAN
jgi:hypothetical protein